MRLRPLPLVLAFASLVTLACTDDEPTVDPFDGVWNFFEMSVENNTCPADIGLLPPYTTFALDYDGGDGFDIEQGMQMDIKCNLTGGPDFVCPGYLFLNIPSDQFELELDVYVRIEGAFDSDTEAHGERQIDVECTGEDCVLLDDLPCSYQLPFTAEAQ